MKPVLAQIRIKKVSAETTNVPVINTKINGTVTQSGNATFGLGPDGQNLVQSSMTLNASIVVENTKETLLTVHSELEAIFVELEPAIKEESTPEELTVAGDFYAAQLYPHAISHINRIFHEMGFGAVKIDIKYPSKLK